MPAEAAAAWAKAGVGVVDGVDRDAGALGIGDGGVDVGAVLIGDAGAAVVRVDTVGDHEDDARLVHETPRLQAGLAFSAGGPVLDEVGEAEVGAGAGTSQAHRDAQALGGGGTICREAGNVASWGHSAVLHVADEDLGPRGQAGDEGLEVIELAADAGAETVVDEQGHLGPVGRDRGKVDERREAVVDLDGEVFAVAATGVLESKDTRAWVAVALSWALAAGV